MHKKIWGDVWVNGTNIFHKKLPLNQYREGLIDHEFGPSKVPLSDPSHYHVHEGKHFAIEGANPAPMPVRSPQIPGCDCESALCGEFYGKTFPKTQAMISLGLHCDGGLAVERWPSKHLTPIVEKLPNASILAGDLNCGMELDPCPFKLIALSPNNIYVTATILDAKTPRPYLAHFDGKTWSDLSPRDAQGFISDFQHDGDDLVLILGNTLWFGSHRSLSWTMSSPRTEGFKWLKRSPDGSYWAVYGKTLFHKVQERWMAVPLPLYRSENEGAEPEAEDVGDPKNYLPQEIAWLPDGSPIVYGTWNKDGDDNEHNEHTEHVVLLAQRSERVYDTSNLRRAQAPKVFGPVTVATPQCGEAIFVILKKIASSVPKNYPHSYIKNIVSKQLTEEHGTVVPAFELAEVNDGTNRYLVLLTRHYSAWMVLEKRLKQNKVLGEKIALCGNTPPIHRSIYVEKRESESESE